MGQTPRSRSHGKKKWYPRKGLIMGNIHVKYQSSTTHYSKGISKVKVFIKMDQTPRSRSQDKKNNGTPKKVLSHGIFV